MNKFFSLDICGLVDSKLILFEYAREKFSRMIEENRAQETSIPWDKIYFQVDSLYATSRRCLRDIYIYYIFMNTYIRIYTYIYMNRVRKEWKKRAKDGTSETKIWWTTRRGAVLRSNFSRIIRYLNQTSRGIYNINGRSREWKKMRDEAWESSTKKKYI